MKVAVKVVSVASVVLIIAISLLSFVKYQKVTSAQQQQLSRVIGDSTQALAKQLSYWLNGKLAAIDLTAQVIDTDFNPTEIKKIFFTPMLQDNFVRMYGGLSIDGKAITNDRSWDATGWDARSRPWYDLAKSSSEAKITAPYTDSETHELVISVVANLTDNGQFKGAFGGDLNLQTVSDATNTVTFNSAGYTFLMDKDGTIITHPDSRFYGQDYSQLFAGERLAIRPNIQEIEVDNQNLWVTFTPIENLSGMHWYIVAVVDADIAMSGANEIAINSFIMEIIGALISVLLLGALMTKILQPVSTLSQSLVEINSGNGDLTKRLPIVSSDEFADVAREFNIFVDNLQGMIGNVQSLADDVHQSNDKVSAESETASRELAVQVAELDQLATAMNQMASSSAEVASNAQVAAQSAVTADKETAVGVEMVFAATESITQLSVLMEDAVESVVELTHFSNNIESILTVITSIADQTNLLALNAAIEAARAGEYGRGFAVVADEVRSLASRTQESTSEIRATIEQLQAGVSTAENNIKESREVAIATAAGSSRVNAALETIRLSIVQINDMNIQIAAASEEQSATAEEINRNTTNIRDISQHVSDGAQLQVQYAQSMKEQVEEQSQQLNQFKV